MSKLVLRSMLVALVLTLTLVISVAASGATLLIGGKTYDAPSAGGGKAIVIVENEGVATAKLWSGDIKANNGTLSDFLAGRSIWFAGISADGRFAFGITSEGMVIKVNMATNEETQIGQAAVPSDFAQRISNRFAAIANDGSILYVAAGAKLMYVNAVGASIEIAQNVVGTPAISADGKVASYVTADGKLYTWANGTAKEFLAGNTVVSNPALNADGTKLAIATTSATYGGAKFDPQILEVMVSDGTAKPVTTAGSNWYPVYDQVTGILYYMQYTSDTAATLFDAAGTVIAQGDGLASVSNGVVIFHKIGEGVYSLVR